MSARQQCHRQPPDPVKGRARRRATARDVSIFKDADVAPRPTSSQNLGGTPPPGAGRARRRRHVSSVNRGSARRSNSPTRRRSPSGPPRPGGRGGCGRLCGRRRGGARRQCPPDRSVTDSRPDNAFKPPAELDRTPPSTFTDADLAPRPTSSQNLRGTPPPGVCRFTRSADFGPLGHKSFGAPRLPIRRYSDAPPGAGRAKRRSCHVSSVNLGSARRSHSPTRRRSPSGPPRPWGGGCGRFTDTDGAGRDVNVCPIAASPTAALACLQDHPRRAAVVRGSGRGRVWFVLPWGR